MPHSHSAPTSERRLPKVTIAVGFAVLACAAIASNVSATPAPKAAAPAAAPAGDGFAYEWTQSVDWERVAPAGITPAHSVGAYER